MQTKRIYLIGGGNGGERCPYDATRWGVNGTCIGKQVQLSFHMHDLEHPERYYITGTQKKENADFGPFLSYVKLKDHPVFSIKEYDGFPSIKRYPYEEICNYFGTNFFSNSICYMLAYAMYKKYAEIHMWGMNLAFSQEYVDELPGVLFWIGMAHQKGYRVGKELQMFGQFRSGIFNLPHDKNYAFEDKVWYTPTILSTIRPATIEQVREAMCNA